MHAKVKTPARVREVANIRVKTPAKEREAARPTEASQSKNQTIAPHIGGCPGRFREGGQLLRFRGRLVLVRTGQEQADRCELVPADRESLTSEGRPSQ
jgi:hypothetical protein